MKRVLIFAARLTGGAAVQLIGLLLALWLLVLGDQPKGGLLVWLASLLVVAASGAVSGFIAQRYFLPLALPLLWLLWAVYISLDQFSAISLGQGPFMDEVQQRMPQILLSSAALAAGVWAGSRLSRRMWPD